MSKVGVGRVGTWSLFSIIMAKTFFILLASLIIVSSAYAQNFTFNGVCYHLIDDNGEKRAEVEQGTDGLLEYNGTVVIPETVTYQGSNYKVTSLAFAAFYDYDDLTSITLPNTIEHIGLEAFSGCINLTNITLPSSLKTIEEGAFNGCGLTSIYIPQNVTSINRNVFMNCGQLRSIVVAPNNSVYDSRENCNAIIQKEDVILMTGCMSTMVPNGVDQIGPDAFRGCTGLTTLKLPIGLGSISFAAFAGCTNLNNIEFPSTIGWIGDDAFEGCTSLTSIYLPPATSLYGNPFGGCSGLTSITVDAANYQYDSRNNCNAIIDKKKNILVTGCQSTIIPSDVVTIGKKSFKGCTELTSINIPSSVTTIEQDAFIGCKSLAAVSIPNSVTRIEGGAFRSCTSLESFVIPNGVTNLESFLTGCTNLRSIIIPAGITKINSTSFSGCKELASIVVEEGNTVYDSRNNCNAVIETATNKLIVGCTTTVIPSDVTEIGSYAFRGRVNLTSINIPEVVNKIRRYAFAECTSLSSVILPQNLNTIEEDAFGGCSSLQEIIIPNGVTKLDNYVFKDCSSLSSVTLPDGITEIGYLAFYKTALKSITLPATLTTIKYHAFYKCKDLTSVTSKSSTPISIDDPFNNMSDITLYVPQGCKVAYEVADYWKDFKEIKEGGGPDGDYVLGDANNDGKLTIADYTAIAHHILNKTPDHFNKNAADVNGDGQINMADYIGVAHLLLYGTIEKPKTKSMIKYNYQIQSKL